MRRQSIVSLWLIDMTCTWSTWVTKLCKTNSREQECQWYPPSEKRNANRDTIWALWHSIDFQWHLLTEQGVQWSQGELGSAGEQTQPSEWAKEDKVTACVKDRAITAVYVSCPIPLHSSLHPALRSVLWRHKQAPLPGRDRSLAYLLNMFAQGCGLGSSVSCA